MRSRERQSSVATFPSWAKISFFILALIKLWLVSGQTVYAVDLPHDDGLFLNLASALLSGRWLGPYTNQTLAKVPFYPIFVAMAFVLNVPLLMAQHILYITACTIFVIAVRPKMPSPTMLLVVYAVLLFNPMSYTNVVMTRVLREGIYPALTILVTAGASGLLTRHDHSLNRLSFWSIGLGFALSAFWLTREEGVWIIPSLLIILIFAALRIWQMKLIDWHRLSLLCVLPFCVWMIGIGAVATINKVRYGVFTTVEFKSSDFLAAYGALSRVRHSHWKSYIVVPKETRERIYAVSPAFAELRQFLEGDLGRGWSTFGCQQFLICDDIAGGWFMWALRDAVAAAGHHESGSSAASYYRRLAIEINSACTDRKLDCFSRRASMMPPWHGEYLRPFLDTLARAAFYLARFEGFNARSSPSWGTEGTLELFRDLTGDKLSGDKLSPKDARDHLQIAGWAFSPSTPITLSVRTAEGRLADPSVKLESSQDVYQYFLSSGRDFPNAREARFDIITSCTSGCYLHVRAGNRLIERLPLDRSVRGFQTAELLFHFDLLEYKGNNDVLPRRSKMVNLKIEFLNRIGKVYQILTPILVILALTAYAISVARNLRRRTITGLLVINTALLIAIVIRLVMLSMIEVTSFRGINIVYLSPAYALLLMFVTLVLSVCIVTFSPIRKGNLKDQGNCD